MGRALRQIMPRTRYEIDLPISLELIGTSNLFKLRTENLSARGLFVKFTEEYLPFTSDSLIEVTLFLGEGEDAPTVNFVAKFIHFQTGLGFGMRIVQMDEVDENLLSDFLSEYSNANPDRQY